MEDPPYSNPTGTGAGEVTARWFVRRDGRVRGPSSGTEIRRLLLSDELSLSDQVSKDGQDWQPLASVPEVVPQLFRRDAQEDERELLKEAGDLQRQALLAVLATLVMVVGILGMVLQLDANDDARSDCTAPPGPGVNWQDCRFSALAAPREDLRAVVLTNAVLPHARLQGALMAEADLRYADLKAVDLSYADLRDAMLKGADLRGADLTYADLRGADLSFADLREARLGGARLEDAVLHGALWIDGRRCPTGSRDSCLGPGQP